MKKFNRLCLVVCVILLSQAGFALNAAHVVWDKSPIALNLPLNQERTVLFPRPVKIVSNELVGFAVIQKSADTFYIKALKPFHQKSVLLQLMPQGDVIKLSVSANEKFNDTQALQITLEEDSHQGQTPNQVNVQGGIDLNTITLTRFAIQSLFAPARVLEVPQGVARVPMQTTKTVNLVYGGGVIAKPLISWGGNGLTVTAVQLKNVLSKPVVLDPRNLLGLWETATFYPTNKLASRGKAQDTTTVFLVSTRSFGDAVKQMKGYVR